MKQIQKGFTLIELMIVVAIIGILAAVAIPQYSNYISRSNAAASLSEMSIFKTALGVCAQETGSIDNCGAGSNGVPAASSTPNLIGFGLAVAGGQANLTGTSKASLADGTPMIFDYESAVVADDAAQMVWTMENTSTICDDNRGIKTSNSACQ